MLQYFQPKKCSKCVETFPTGNKIPRYLIARPELDPRPSFRPKPGKNVCSGHKVAHAVAKNIRMEKRFELGERLEERKAIRLTVSVSGIDQLQKL